ncbi:hypothetical protein CQW23_16648 [Capsicum baccatum]|uniref:Uncharacterized protein n=1 Tax=Capsicum baccatum TaxID=33114 RepID=A0A2G2WBJ5_CAPBA|nr:hypothetical protein CQW23_16648 [Capsicum baccatum]
MVQAMQARNSGGSGFEDNHSANCVGKCSTSDVFDFCFTTLGFNLWIIDLGACQYMTHDKYLPYDVKCLENPILVLSLRMQVVFGRAVGGLYVLDESQNSESFSALVEFLFSKNKVSSLDLESNNQALQFIEFTVNGESPP